MKKFIFVMIFAVSFVFSGSALADGLFTKVSSWTLDGNERILTASGDMLVTTTNIPGFMNQEKCAAAMATRADRVYPDKDNTLKAARSQFVGECYEVKEVVPVIEFVAP